MMYRWPDPRKRSSVAFRFVADLVYRVPELRRSVIGAGIGAMRLYGLLTQLRVFNDRAAASLCNGVIIYVVTAFPLRLFSVPRRPRTLVDPDRLDRNAHIAPHSLVC